jgi:hypothetical protein
VPGELPHIVHGAVDLVSTDRSTVTVNVLLAIRADTSDESALPRIRLNGLGLL